MKKEIIVPSFGESISEASVAQILKPLGSFVKKDEEILELESDKVNAPVLAPESGTLSLSVKVGDSVKIGQVLGFVDTEEKATSAEPEPLPPNVALTPEVPPPQVIVTPSEYSKVRIQPEEFITSLTAHAKERLEQVKKPVPVQSTPNGNRKKMTSLRKTIASKLVQVKNETAMLTTFNEVDMSAILQIRNEEKDNFLKKYGVKLGFMSFFVKAVVFALKAYPAVNALIEGDEIVSFSTCDIGIAVSTEKGLVVPIVRGCENLTFAEIENGIGDFSKKAKEGKLTMQDFKGGSFTITNGGTFGSLLSTPILNPPQSAILGMHAIKERPMVINGEIKARPMMYLALSYDHRLIDGKEAVGFLVHIKEHLEDPAKLLLNF